MEGSMDYINFMAPALISLGSLGLLTPFFVEGALLFSVVVMIGLYSLSNYLKKYKKEAYLYAIFAGLCFVFGISYIGGNIFLVISGIGYLILSLVITDYSIKRIMIHEKRI